MVWTREVFHDSFVDIKDFKNLSVDSKDSALLEAFVWAGKPDTPIEFGLHRRQFSFESSYEEAVNKLRKNIFKIAAHTDSFIEGNIILDADGLLFLSIPFDPGWSLKVNGRKTNIEKVNIGFMGVFLRKGSHNIKLRYSVPFLKIGGVISSIGLLFYLFLLFRSPCSFRGIVKATRFE